MLPTFMRRLGWSEGQKSGNQVNYGWWLADKRERKRVRERESSRGRAFFFLLFFSSFGWILLGHCSKPGLTWPRVLSDLLWRSKLDLFSHRPPPWVPPKPFFLYGYTSSSNFTRIHAHLQILKPQLCFLFVSVLLMMQKRRNKAPIYLFVLYLIKKPEESFSSASVRQATSKHNYCSVHTSVALKTNRALFPADRSVRWGFMLVLAHNGTSADLWSWHWPLLFQGLGAETDVGKLPHVNKRMGPTC